MIGASLAIVMVVPLAQPGKLTPYTLWDESVAELSVEVAALLNSEAATRVQLRKLKDETFPQQFATDPNFAVLEQEYPGITREVIDAMMPVVTASAIDELPGLQRELATVYAKYLNAAELAQMLRFYRGATGTKLIDAVNSGLDFSQLVGAAMRAGDEAEATEQDLDASINAGVSNMIRVLADEEAAEVVKFGTSPVGRKLVTVNAEVQKLAVAIANRPRPEMEKQVEAAMTNVMQRRMAPGESK